MFSKTLKHQKSKNQIYTTNAIMRNNVYNRRKIFKHLLILAKLN